jgi:YidC/Oxa1 family membrane protein insertase
MMPIANILQPLIDVFESVLIFFHDTVGFGWGFSIIAMTVVVRAALVPLTYKQLKSMSALQKLQPQLKELQAKYKDDKQRLQQETMKFYQEHKVNPFGACLPLVLQMPVFIALFYMLREDLRFDICPQINPPGTENPKPCGSTDASQFLFIPDITDKATGGVLVALLILYVGSQLFSSVVMAVSADPMQRRIMMALPFVFVPFIIGFPAGLLVYWITTNVWTIGQQYVIRKTIGHPSQHAKEAAEAAAASPAGARAAAAPERRPRPRGGQEPEGKPAEVPRRATAPPPPPRRKKKRSGRRR